MFVVGVSLLQLLAAEQQATHRPRAESVVFYQHYGAPSQLESFDRKPKAPDDQGFVAFIENLYERGLLADTLVVWCGEFGCNPHIVLAGASVKRGFVNSDSDRLSEYPASDPHSPGDLAATILSSLGLNPHTHFHDRDGRPFPLADGEFIEGVFA